MLDIHRRTGILFLVAVVSQMLLISWQVQTSSGISFLQAGTFGVMSQVQIGASHIFGGFRYVWDGYFALRGAHEENQRLKDEVATLGLQVQQMQALARRGVQLEQMLGVREQTSLKTLTTNVIALDATGMFWTVTIDRGSSDGVKADMAVIAPQGVVGRVVDSPGSQAAKVQLLIDRNAGAGAIIERTGAGGVVVGNDSNPPLQMDFVANLADVKVGDRVATSGLDGIYPPGFVIGWVAKVQDGQGLYKHIEINPAVDFRALQTALVVLDPPEKPKPGEGPGGLTPAQTPPAAATQNQPAGANAPARPAATAPANAAPRNGAAPNTSGQKPPAQSAPASNRPAPNRSNPPAPTPPATTPPAATPPVTPPATATPNTQPPVVPPPPAAPPVTPVPGGAR